MNSRPAQSHSIQRVFPLVLFLVFGLCALLTVLIGGQAYQNISSRMEQDFSGATAVSYIAGKVRQNDRPGAVRVVQREGQPVLLITEELEETRYETLIYWREGALWELFTEAESGLTLADGLAILDCPGLELAMEDRLLTVEVPGQGGGRVQLWLRSERGQAP